MLRFSGGDLKCYAATSHDIQRGRNAGARPLSLKNETNIAFVFALLILGVIGWFSIQGNRNNSQNDHLVSHERDILEASELLRSHVYDAAVARRTYITYGDAMQVDAFRVAVNAANA